MSGQRLRFLVVTCLALAMALVIAACGGDDDGGGGSSGATETGTTEGAKKIDPASMDSAKGEVVYCTGKDTSGAQTQSVKDFNEEFGSQGVTAKLLEFPESADEQRNQFTQRQRAKSGDCDIFYADVVWTAEFASQKWLYDMSPYVQQREKEFIPATFDSVKYDGKFFGVPKQTDAAFIYRRTDKVKEVPATWQELYQVAADNGGMAYQGAAYEGLTVAFLEIAFAAGGAVLSEDGKKSAFNSAENVEALELMVNGIKDGAAPKAVTTYMEEQARRAFEAGRVNIMRNWPYAYALGEKSKIKGKFEVSPFPKFEGGGTAGILGGHNLVVSAYSKNAGGALKLIDFLTSEKIMAQDAAKFSLAPVLTATYNDASVKKALPFAAELKEAVAQAKSRPVSPVYTQISQAIYKNVNAALGGQMEPKAAIEKADGEIDQALETF